MNDEKKLVVKTVQLYGAARSSRSSWSRLSSCTALPGRQTARYTEQSEHNHRTGRVDACQATMMKSLNKTFSFFCMYITQLWIFNTSYKLLWSPPHDSLSDSRWCSNGDPHGIMLYVRAMVLTSLAGSAFPVNTRSMRTGLLDARLIEATMKLCSQTRPILY